MSEGRNRLFRRKQQQREGISHRCLHIKQIPKSGVQARAVQQLWETRAPSSRMQSGSSGYCSSVLGRGRRQEPWRKINDTTWEGKVSRIHDSLHDFIASDVNNDVTSVVDKTVKHVQISKYVQIKFLDDEAPVPEIPAVDSNIFSIDITNDSDVFADDQLLLDTCAGESVFRTATLFYDIVPADTLMVVNGVNRR